MNSVKICVCGSINMDLVVETPQLPFPGETIMARNLQEVPGGKGANQAVSAARLGAEVFMVAKLGNDGYGQKMRANLEREGISTTYVKDTAGTSGLAIVAVEDSGENSILVIPGANGRLLPEDIDNEVIASSDVVILQLEIPLTTVLHVIATAKRFGKKVIMNPAPAPDIFDDRLLDVDVFCPNLTEAEKILHTKILNREDALRSVQSLVRLGASKAIITLGDEGAVVAESASKATWIPPFDIVAVDTTAAGDAFMGALAMKLAQGAKLVDAAKFASAAGACAATVSGAQPSLPYPEDIDRLLTQSPNHTVDTI